MIQSLRAWKRAAVVVLSAGTLLQAASCAAVDTEALVQSVVGAIVTDFVFGFFNVTSF